MGEEIILSSRLWTSGYDIFSPAQAVVGHIYFRRHKPKFWESVHRALSMGIHNPLQVCTNVVGLLKVVTVCPTHNLLYATMSFLQALVLDRIKYQLGFPEAARDMLAKSILTAVEKYSMGNVRHVEDYMKIIGMDPMTKEVTEMRWCENGVPPPGFEKFSSLYQT